MGIRSSPWRPGADRVGGRALDESPACHDRRRPSLLRLCASSMTENWPREFDAMVERKTRQASAAAIPGFLTTVRGGHAGLTAIGNAWSREIFDGPFYVRDPGPVEPSVSLVLVQSLDGNIVADDPATLGGGLTDQHLVYEGLSRVAADAVLAGARTVGPRTFFSVWHPCLGRSARAVGETAAPCPAHRDRQRWFRSRADADRELAWRRRVRVQYVCRRWPNGASRPRAPVGPCHRLRRPARPPRRVSSAAGDRVSDHFRGGRPGDGQHSSSARPRIGPLPDDLAGSWR